MSNCTVLILQVFLTGSHPRVNPNSTELNRGSCWWLSVITPCKHCYTHVSLPADSSYWKLEGVHHGHGRNIFQLADICSLSIFGVLGFVSKRLIFQCYFRNNEGKRKRETPAFTFPFHSHSGWAVNTWLLPSSFLFELLFRKVMPGSVFKTGLGSSREAKGVCPHSVVGAFHFCSLDSFQAMLCLPVSP